MMSMVNEEDKGNQVAFKSYHSGSELQVRNSDIEKSINQHTNELNEAPSNT